MAQVNTRRTAAEFKNPDYNYFIAFKIDLNEKDKVKIDSKIKTVLSSTTGTVVGRRLLELKNDVNEIMLNDATFNGSVYVPNSGGRAQEAAAAKNFKLKSSVAIIEILCQTRKTLLKSEIIDIWNTANKPVVYFTEDEFMKALSYLSGIGVKIVNNLDTQIPFSDYQQVEKRLEPLGKKDLYEFLGLTKRATQSEIQKASDDVYRESGKTSDLKKKQSVSQLCSNVKKFMLDSPEARKAYDQYLTLKADVWDEFAQRKGFGIKEISMDEYTNYTQKVINLLKVSINEAEKIIGIGCKYFQLTVIGKSDSNSFEYCPHCGKLCEKSAKSCPHCKKSLEIICWNCKQPTRVLKTDKGCSHCGATNYAHELFNTRCQTLDRLLSRQSVDSAELQSAFLELKNVVPNYLAHADSTVAKKVKEYDSVISARMRQEETVGSRYREELAKIQELVAKRCYRTALSAAKGLPAKFNTYNAENSSKLIADISAVVQSAERQVTLAKQYMAYNNISLAISTAAKALDVCADLPDARQIMQKYPPNTPSDLRVSVAQNKVRLEWDDNVREEFVTYTVIKKIGIAPTSPDDGSVVEKGLSVKFYEDANIVSATPYFYAVYAERYGVRSALATSFRLATIYADVVNVQQEVVNGGIKVVWEAPQNVKSIEVWRASGTVAPERAGVGAKIDANKDGFYDSKCNGNNAYLIICNYDVRGKIIKSQGVKAVFKPYEAIAPLSGVKVTPVESNRFAFSCNQGYVGKIKLYYAQSKLPIPFNTTLKYIDFNSICKGLSPLDAIANANGELTFALPKGRIYHVYPTVSTEQLFVVSNPILINTIDGLMSPSHTVANGTLTVTGVLHSRAQAVIVKIDHKKFIETVDGGGEKFTFKAEEFRKENRLQVKLKTNSVNYVSIFVEFKDDGILSYSSAILLDSPIDYREAVTVLYSMNYTVSATKRFKITLNFEADSSVEVPAMLIMQGWPKPLNKNAGKLCEKIEGVTLKKAAFSKKCKAKKVITVGPVATNTKFALFLNEETSNVQMKEVRTL